MSSGGGREMECVSQRDGLLKTVWKGKVAERKGRERPTLLPFSCPNSPPPSLKTVKVAYVHTIVSRESTHGRSTLQGCIRGRWVLFRVLAHLAAKMCLCHVYSIQCPQSNQLDKHVIQQSLQQLRSQVLTAHNALNATMITVSMV